MPPQRADAAHIAPYLTHLITHHGQLTLVPPDNNGRRRKEKQSKSSRTPPREEPVRFNSGPTAASSSSPRRARRTEQEHNNLLEDIPDYPPPSFQEALLSPPVSVCPSTTTLGQFTIPQSSRHGYNSDSDSESDDTSLDIVDTGGLPPSRGPATERPSLQSQTIPRGRGILDSDPDDMGVPSSSNVRVHRRHLSLSPLRTLFPSRNFRESGPALSAQSTPSHSLAFSRASPFFRSTTSLRNLTSATPLPPPSPSSPPSVRSENFLGPKRFFSHKGKERATSEALDSWEIVESQLPESPTIPPPPQEASPQVANMPPRSPASMTSAPIHPLSERDHQTKSRNRIPPTVPSPARERERRAPPPRPPSPPASVPIVPGAGPPIVTVRTKKAPPPPPPKKKPQPISSPLRPTDRSCALAELELDRAVRTPLPLTPVTGSPTSLFALSTELASPVVDEVRRVPSPAPRSPSGASENATPSVDADSEDQHPHHRHYPGRPLPRRPRVVVDSTYAPHPDFPQAEQPAPSVPEGLLIDLNDAETLTAPVLPTPVSADLNELRPTATDMQRASSASSVDLAAPATPRPEFLEVTDLDVLLSRLENDQRDGGNYDAMLFLSEFIGPATPVRLGRPSAAPWDSATKKSVLLTGAIEVQRRRTTKDGRVKLKLALLGIAVDRCGICLTQFRKAERARLIDACKHAFHERCLARWVVRSCTCPLCRVVLDLDAGGGAGHGCR
ncbi:hypothetical protein FB451DRAFT_1151098 [Mycena latifolia]|nr:hypothetical protein FB451DRAFT_1151098 [Mycena latifolia]